MTFDVTTLPALDASVELLASLAGVHPQVAYVAVLEAGLRHHKLHIDMNEVWNTDSAGDT